MKHAAIWLVVALGGALAAPEAAAQQPEEDPAARRERIEALMKASPPEFEPPRPFISPNVRLGFGLGLFALSNDGAEQARLTGGALDVWAHVGDEFWDRLGYYIPLRITVMPASGLTVSGQTMEGEALDEVYETSAGLALEGGLGVDVWLWPQIFALSLEGIYSFHAMELTPDDPNDYDLETTFGSVGARARATARFKVYSIQGEYQIMAPMRDATDDSRWTGWRAFLSLGYSPDWKFGGVQE